MDKEIYFPDLHLGVERKIILAMVKQNREVDNSLLYILQEEDKRAFDEALIFLKDNNQNIEKSLKDYIYNIKSQMDLDNLGFLGVYKDDNGLPKLNPNVFSKYIDTTYELAIFNEDTFYIFNGRKWSKLSDLHIKSRLKRLIDLISLDLWNPSLETRYLEALKREVMSINEFNINRNYITLSNGVLNLDSYKLEKYNSSLLSTIEVPIEYDTSADCPTFEAFLHDIFENDEEIIYIIQEIMGYCLTGSTKAQKAFIFLGSGANGKSVLCDIITELCGLDNVSSITLKELSGKFAKTAIINKTVNISTENEMDGNSLATGEFKKIVSGDILQVEEKYKNTISYRPMAKLIFALNSMPKTYDISHGYFRRLLIIPFSKQYSFTNEGENKANPNLTEELLLELPGILNFALVGLKRLQGNDYVFSNSEAVNKELDDYKAEVDIVTDFVGEKILVEEYCKTTREDIRYFFDQWCYENSNNKYTNMPSRKFWRRFRNALDSLGIQYSESKSNGNRVFIDINIKGKLNKGFERRRSLPPLKENELDDIYNE